MNPALRVFLPIVGLAVGLYAGCSKEEAQAPIENACQGIIDACHTKDDGSDAAINDCHSLAHDGDDAACSPRYEECVAVCDEAPEVGVYGDDGDDHGDGDAGSDDGTPGTTTGPSDGGTTTGATDDDGTTDGGSTDGGSTNDTGSTGNDDASNANCDDLGSGCHDIPGEVPQMCHDVGHDGDETACAAIWVQCVEACGL